MSDSEIILIATAAGIVLILLGGLILLAALNNPYRISDSQNAELRRVNQRWVNAMIRYNPNK